MSGPLPHAIHANPLFLITAEILLYSAFAAHLYLAFSTKSENSQARGEVGLTIRQSKRPGRVLNLLGYTPDSTMFFTGAIVLFFLIVHLCDFKFELFHGGRLEQAGPFEKARLILSDGVRKLVYLVGSVFLGVHVSHGFGSALQSLGLNHPRSTRVIPYLGGAFALLVAGGFIVITMTGANLK